MNKHKSRCVIILHSFSKHFLKLNMSKATSIFNQLNNPNLKLSKSAHKVAAIVMQNPESVINSSIANVAITADVSEPTVNRFCRTLGCQGFPDFKVKLAQELASGASKITRGIEMDDSIQQIIEKIFDSTHASLAATQAASDNQQIENAINVLADARSILFVGLGASSSVALDAQHKFLRFDMPVIAHTDILNQRMTAAGLGPNDVAVCISYTGRTTELIEVAKIAKQKGASVIGITTSESPLANECSLVLPIVTPEDTEVHTPMTSRINHLVLIDVLATGLAVKRGAPFNQHLQQIKDSLADTRLPIKN